MESGGFRHFAHGEIQRVGAGNAPDTTAQLPVALQGDKGAVLLEQNSGRRWDFSLFPLMQNGVDSLSYGIKEVATFFGRKRQGKGFMHIVSPSTQYPFRGNPQDVRLRRGQTEYLPIKTTIRCLLFYGKLDAEFSDIVQNIPVDTRERVSGHKESFPGKDCLPLTPFRAIRSA